MFSRKNKIILIVGIIFIVVLLTLATNQILYLRKAHSTFDNYYAFRGCTNLLQKTDTYGVCQTNSGETIKIVKYNDKWYLDGDLPWACLGSLCFGI